ncbi:MAG: J domain-containing protein [Deltaproteobacteria bacterium]|nr:J domain-containing protein [Deltaproteobacteria bacterium]
MIFIRLQKIIRANLHTRISGSGERITTENPHAEAKPEQSDEVPPASDFHQKERRYENEMDLKYYSNLELPPGSSPEEIKRSYRQLLKRYHPDRFHLQPDQRALAEEITAGLNEAWAWFRNKHKKI